MIQTINYSEVQDWDKEAIRLNKGKGVDFVIEIGGRGTIARSIRATRQGGLVAVSGEYMPLSRASHPCAVLTSRLHVRLWQDRRCHPERG